MRTPPFKRLEKNKNVSCLTDAFLRICYVLVQVCL